MPDLSLTPKQQAFVNGVVSGLSYREAYEEAGYSTNMKRGNVAHEASKLARHPKIAPLIAAGQQEALDKAVEAGAWSRTKAIERLEAINDKAYMQLVKASLIERETLSAFFGSLDRLNELSGINDKEASNLIAPVFYFNPREVI